MVTLSKISEVSGFSVPVVSRVLSANPHKDARVAASTRAHILAVASRLNYRPNRSAEFLRRGRSPIIGCFLPSTIDSLLARLIKGISEEARINNFPLAFYYESNKASYSDFIAQSSQSRNCGIITYPTFKLNPELEELISDYTDKGGNIVLIEAANQWQWKECTSVSVDNYYGGQLAAKHLLADKKLEHFFTQKYSHISERVSGFTETLQKKNKDVTVAKNFQELVSLLKAHKNFPAGVFVPRGPDAVRLLCILEREKIDIPEQIKLIGYDNLNLMADTVPALTCIEQPFEEIGKLAIKKLIEKIYEKETESVLVKPKLIIRESG